jgi:hypothetical protein
MQPLKIKNNNMIQASDLKIGSWMRIYWSHSGFDEIQINATDILLIEQKQGGYEHYHPIPTTEDHLLKLGFNKEYKKGWIGIDVRHESGMTTDFIIAEPFSMGEWQSFYAFVYDSHRFVKLEFLHQVQNLFHAMTQKELCLINKS